MGKKGKQQVKLAKTFGLGVLLKLTKKHMRGMDISCNGKTVTVNMTMGKLADAVNATIKAHHICLKI